MAATGIFAFGLQFKMTLVRKETFARNHALFEKEYLAKHKEAFGEDASISKFGYPDMGNNIYSDCLSYKDWVTVNNAQRTHDNFQHQLPIMSTCAFISAISYPRFTFYLLLSSFVLRLLYTSAYLSFRGHNRATASEEVLKLMLVILVGASFMSSRKIMGLEKWS